MMKLILILLSWLLFTNFCLSQDIFYYSRNSKVKLTPIPNEILIKLVDSINVIDVKEFISKYYGNLNESEIKRIKKGIYHIKSSESKVTDLNYSLIDNDNIKCINPYYKTEFGDTIGISDEIVFRQLPTINDSLVEEICKKYQVTVIKKTTLFQVAQISKGFNTIEVANQLYEEGLFSYVQPSFVKRFILHRYIPNDEYFNMQFTLHNTGQIFNEMENHSGTVDADIDAPEAWDITKGDVDIKIAVLDQGVTEDHPDLPYEWQIREHGSNFAATYDNSDPDDPSPVGNDNHGNACAGVIAAKMNFNLGIAGIAPNCIIMPIRMPFGFGWDEQIAEDIASAIIFAVDKGAKILSNSWGSPDNSDLEGDNYDPTITDAIHYASVEKNCIVIYSAGNWANHELNDDGYILFPANINIPEVFTVGASDRDDKQSNFSPTSHPKYGFNQIIDIVAPSNKAQPEQYISDETWEMWSIDIPGNIGYNPNPYTFLYQHPPLFGEIYPSSGSYNISYTGRFGGTSHSCPVVAGVAALVLSINPNLIPTEVFDILTKSADKVGGYNYDANGYSKEMGYGRVNAFNAVMSACPDHYTINWNIEEDETLEYQAGNYIEAESEIASGAKIMNHAGNYVRLKPGFHANFGCKYHAFIQECGIVTSHNDNTNFPFNDKYKSKDSIITSNIKIYPNPNSGVFIIDGLMKDSYIYIYDFLGNLVYNNKLIKNQNFINIQELVNGLYFIKINIGNSLYFDKIIINK